MSNVETALLLAEKLNFEVFPLKQDGKPYTEHGFKEATSDPDKIKKMWHEDALIGVYTGGSDILVLDLDMKVSPDGEVLVDGFTSLDEAWLDVPETFAYDSRNGLGRHLVYRAPEGVNLPRSMGYRGMKGVDRCSGNGYVAWMGGVPEPGEIAEAPEWLLDSREAREIQAYEGTLRQWFEGLTPGEPNALVRRAWDRADERFESLGNDFSHSDMVEIQFEAVRLGSEGNSGVPELLEHLEELFLSREGSHSRPAELWDEEWKEALLSAVEKYGASIDLLKNLPEYSIGLVPKGVPDTLVTSPTDKAGFSKLLGALIKETEDDNRILSILWNCPATKDLARDWGLEFTFKRIQDARLKPEPVRENPRIEEKREAEVEGRETDLNLLTDEERELIASRPTFVDKVTDYARSEGYDQFGYFRSAGWNLISMTFGTKAYIPVSATQRHGVNIWQIVPGWSGTGKSVVEQFAAQALDVIMNQEGEEVAYDLGTDSSIQGLHLALLQRDGKASLFKADEASGWFKRIKVSEWTTGMEDTLADWYMGKVAPSNKISLKEFRGKRATTSFNLHMFATPDRLMETLTRDQFGTGFLARVMWTFGEPPKDDDSGFDLFSDSMDDVVDVVETPEIIRELAADLIGARAFIKEPIAVKPTPEVRARLVAANEAIKNYLKNGNNWDITQPALVRHAEVMLKIGALCALYREDDEIQMVDALHAIAQVETWVKNLERVAELISQGDFQRRCDELEAYLRQVGGSATGAKIFFRFKNWIVRDSKEIDNVLTYLVQSGIVNREEVNGGVRYSLNGQD